MLLEISKTNRKKKVMGPFESIKNFMNKPSVDRLGEANGQKAIEERALRLAHREKEAALSDIENGPSLGGSAVAQSLRAEVEADHAQYGTDIGEKKLGLPAKNDQNDQFNIPDVEPTVTKVEDKKEETAEVEDHEEIAA